MEVVLMDMFTVPEASKEAFLEQTGQAQQFIRTLPGFVEGFIYEQREDASQFDVVTVAVWESPMAFENAKLTIADEYKKRGFNPREILQNLNIEMIRSTYNRTPY